jgi:hypothetical protein
MKWTAFAGVLLLVAAVGGWPLPVVDGKVSEREYSHSLSLIYGDATLSYAVDGSGGLYLALSARTMGWVGVGLGSAVMDGAHIFMGFLKEGKPVVSEQEGKGHGHAPSAATWADARAVGEESGVTTLELHVPGDRVRWQGGRISFIVAFAGTPDLATFHEDNHDGGFIDLRPDPSGSTLQ